MKKKNRCDHYGLCVEGFAILFSSDPPGLTSFLNTLATDPCEIRNLVVAARAYGKDKGNCKPQRTRVILPLPAILILIDSLLAVRMHEICDVLPLPLVFFEGARTKRQCLDIAFSCQLFVEKGLDSKSVGAVAAGDVGRFYDSIKAFLVASWFVSQGLPPALAKAFVFLHSLPTVEINIEKSSTSVGARAIGLLTGSRSSNAAARGVIADCVLANAAFLFQKAFKPEDGVCMALASFIDNLYSFGRTLIS